MPRDGMLAGGWWQRGVHKIGRWCIGRRCACLCIGRQPTCNLLGIGRGGSREGGSKKLKEKRGQPKMRSDEMKPRGHRFHTVFSRDLLEFDQIGR